MQGSERALSWDVRLWDMQGMLAACGHVHISALFASVSGTAEWLWRM